MKHNRNSIRQLILIPFTLSILLGISLSSYFAQESNASSLETSLNINRNKVKSLYREALALYKAKRLQEAKEKFLEIENQSPHYKATTKILSKIEKEIQKQDARAFEKRQQEFYNQMRLEKKKLRQQEPNEAAASQLISQKVSSPKAVQTPDSFSRNEQLTKPAAQRPNRKEIILQVKNRQKELQSQREEIHKEFSERLESLYAKAIDLYKSGRTEESQEIFNQVSEVSPRYKSVDQYISKIKEQMNRQKNPPKKGQKELIKEPPSRERKDNGPIHNHQLNPTQDKNEPHMNQNRTESMSPAKPRNEVIGKELLSMEKKSPVRTGSPQDFKPSDSSSKDTQKGLSKKEKIRQKRLNDKAEIYYSKAVKFYMAQDYHRAQKKFREADKLIPNYRNTRDYLSRLEKLIHKGNRPLIKIDGSEIQ